MTVEGGIAEGRKTGIWNICGNDGTALGLVSWYGSWRQYIFDPCPNCIFNNQCLRDIAAFLDRINAEQKEKRESR